MRESRLRLALLFVVYVSVSSPAYAYLDPATGSILVQTLIGAVATWLMYSKMYANKAKSYIARLIKGPGSDKPE